MVGSKHKLSFSFFLPLFLFKNEIIQLVDPTFMKFHYYFKCFFCATSLINNMRRLAAMFVSYH